MEELLQNPWWNKHFEPAERTSGFDYVSRTRSAIVEVQKRAQGLRGFYAGIMRLALELERKPTLEWACLVIETTGLSIERLKEEWEVVRRLFNKGIAIRLSIVALGDNQTWIDPEEPFIRKIADSFEPTAILTPDGQLQRIGSFAGRRYFEAVKVLLNRWLRNEGPVSIGRLARDVGCTYPTIRESLRRLEAKKYLLRESDRSVQLSRFPYEVWRELLALAPSMRPSIRFTDESGEKPDAHGLLERLNRKHPKHTALGGVTAARFWHSEFDLHGTPRVNLVVHAPTAIVDLGFIKRLDPALRQNDDPDASPVLVIHPLVRATSLFSETMNGRLPYADPVETVLDLQQLGLSKQADDLLTHFRKEIRKP